MFNQNKAQLLGTAIERSEEGNYFRVSTYKNRLPNGPEIKEAVLVTRETIQAEIDRLDAQIEKLQEQKALRQSEKAEVSA